MSKLERVLFSVSVGGGVGWLTVLESGLVHRPGVCAAGLRGLIVGLAVGACWVLVGRVGRRV